MCTESFVPLRSESRILHFAFLKNSLSNFTSLAYGVKKERVSLAALRISIERILIRNRHSGL